MPHFRLITFVCCAFALFVAPDLRAGDVTAIQLLPDTTVGYVEVTDAAVEVWGKDRVGVRVSPAGSFTAGCKQRQYEH